MAEMLVQSENLVAIADKIRVLSGTEGGMTIAQMDSNLGEANTDVATEADLIEQIASVLEGKAGGGSSGVVETCSITNIYDGGPFKIYYIDANMTLQNKTLNPGESITDVLKNSICCILSEYSVRLYLPGISDGNHDYVCDCSDFSQEGSAFFVKSDITINAIR